MKGDAGDHDDEEHAEDEDHDHDHSHEHADHTEEAQHSAFHVSYAFACEDDNALTTISFPFFDQFENAQEIEVQYVTETAAGQAEITRDAADLKLE